jgi:hypothetical protein
VLQLEHLALFQTWVGSGHEPSLTSVHPCPSGTPTRVYQVAAECWALHGPDNTRPQIRVGRAGEGLWGVAAESNLVQLSLNHLRNAVHSGELITNISRFHTHTFHACQPPRGSNYVLQARSLLCHNLGSPYHLPFRVDWRELRHPHK